MLIGLVWFRKSYPVRDYIVVALLVLGLYVFMNGDAKASPKGILSDPDPCSKPCGPLVCNLFFLEHEPYQPVHFPSRPPVPRNPPISDQAPGTASSS